VFETMSGRNMSRQASLLAKVRDKIRKRISQHKTKEDVFRDIEGLAEYVVQISKETAYQGHELRFADLLRMKIAEHDAFKFHYEVDYAFDETAFRRSLSKLLELAVFQMGVSQNCPRCGNDNWFAIDQARQASACSGCSYEYSLVAEPDISYRLSSLARTGISANGLIPVVLVLGQMLKDARSSFFFTPSLDLFEVSGTDGTKYNKVIDADIVCIKDGEFIIGAVKERQSLFTFRQMQALAAVAKAVEADVLLFSSLDAHVNAATRTKIEKIQNQLRGSRTQVGWYELDADIFHPTRGDC